MTRRVLWTMNKRHTKKIPGRMRVILRRWKGKNWKWIHKMMVREEKEWWEYNYLSCENDFTLLSSKSNEPSMEFMARSKKVVVRSVFFLLLLLLICSSSNSVSIYWWMSTCRREIIAYIGRPLEKNTRCCTFTKSYDREN